ncbi:MAG: response regulator [Chloroflexi bacterium]|nr:response regulator [Chloroflexota bacterium]
MAEKILIVDDDLDTLKLVGLILQRQGYEIIAASTGSQGLAKAASDRPDLILLDVMMPDMEGFEVTRRLRASPDLGHIPIIMFTAKTMVDDKVTGFEAGADDYMTKPTHPAELVSRVKALLARSGASAAARPSAAPTERAHIVGVLGAKGGLGASTLALNLGTASAQAGEDTVLCDLRPGQGTLSLQLGFTQSPAVGLLLSKSVGEITTRAIETQITTHARSGLRLLMSSPSPSEASLASAAAQAEQLVRQTATMCKVLVLDLGAGFTDINKKVLPLCDRFVLIVEPVRLTLTMGKAILSSLETLGLNPARVDVAMVNRVRSSLQVAWQQAEQLLGHNIATVITSAPELAYQAAEACVPMTIMQPDSLLTDQVNKLAEIVVQGKRGGSALTT